MTRTRPLHLGLSALSIVVLTAGCGRRDHDDTATTDAVAVETTTSDVVPVETSATAAEPVTTTTAATPSTATPPSTAPGTPAPTATAAPTATTDPTATSGDGAADLAAELDAVEATLAGLDDLDAEARDAVAQTDSALAHGDAGS